MKKRFTILLASMAILCLVFFNEHTQAEPLPKKAFLESLVQKSELENRVKNGRILRLVQGVQDEGETVEAGNSDEVGYFDFAEHGLQSEYTDEEVLALGFVPNEIVVKFRDNSIDLTTEQGQVLAENSLDNFASGIILTALQEYQQNNQNSFVPQRSEIESTPAQSPERDCAFVGLGVS
jgi:hypothetical protein